MSEANELTGGAEFYFKKAYELQMKGKLEEAATYYKKSIEIKPTAEAHTFLGWTYSYMDRLLEAIDECTKAIEVDPDFGNPYNDIGAYLIELGEPDRAIQWLERAIQAKRYEPRQFPHFNLARIYIQKWMIPEAIEHLKKALAIDPNYALARQELTKLLAKMN